MLEEKKRKEPLVTLIRSVYVSVRRVLVYVLIVAFSTSSLIQNQNYKAVVLSALGITLLFLLFDIYNELNRRLSGIEECVKSPAPLEFHDFRAAEEDIYRTIADSLVESSQVDLDLLTFSGSYSWRFIEDAVRRLIIKYGSTKRISINVGLVHPAHFDRWSLPNWKRKAEVTMNDIEVFKLKYQSEINKGQICLQKFLFDNLPHWHGILINGTVLYMGRTEWEFFNDGSNRAPEILVGQVEYRRFQMTDRFGGKDRIHRFKNWMDRYMDRDNELS